MAIIRSQSVSASGSSPAGNIFFSHLGANWIWGCFFLATVCNTLCFHLPDKKKKKEESKVPLRDIKEKTPDEDKKKDKPKAHAPSHTKIRSIGKVVVMRSEYHWP